MSNWPIEKLKGKINIKHGFPFKGEFFSEQKTEFIVLTPGNFYETGGFKRQPGKEKFYTGDFPEEYIHSKGDVIVAMTEQAAGLLGSCARVPESGLYLHNQRLGLIKTNPQYLLKDYVYYLFRTNTVREQIRLTSSGSKVKHTSPERIYDVKVPLPDVKTQQKIVDILDGIEDKLELNNRINSKLEAMAKMLYDYWFVQFDFPDANGKPYKTSGGKMAYNAMLKREIPVGWNTSTLWNIAKYTNGLPMQKYREDSDTYLPVIKIREMNNGISADTERARVDIPEAAIINDGDVLFSWSATLDVKIWSQGKGALNQHIFKVSSDSYPKSFYYFELLNYLKHFKMIADLRKTTMGHITLDHLKQAYICLPPLFLLEEFHCKVENIFQQHLLLEKENRSLIKLRDWLLPILMNGQVKIK
ncbi:restriction endonuclease [Salmonella enterica]|nr:restriction endonuclease subunit S [Salmonella enterica]EDX5493107.1 restriction endonuclease subunit S [Salmonella enterica subsp. arizonae]EDZ9094002.1 restriction endonuclease subunit S [Salmonella enterica]EED4850635.1 restriction endonuclease subunit S [Salmonella enterica subsp. arizonae]EEG9609517.1 restriction endonuclease subunit S [Salmonella enterica]